MATAFTDLDDISDNCVQPKQNSKPNNLESIREKAYIPESLPKDFLRVLLNEQQINETTDEELARRLQFGVSNQTNMQRTTSSPYRGRLQIDIIEARLNKNYGLLTRMDPYVRLTIANKIYETPTDYNGGKNPKWNKSILCYIPRNVDQISIELFDEKSFTDDDLIAFVKYPLSSQIFEGNYRDEWLPLSGKLGEQKEGSINIKLSFTPMEKVTNQVTNIGYLTNNRRAGENFAQYANLHLNQPRPEDLVNENMDNELNRAIELSSTEAASLVTYTEQDLTNLKEMFPSFDVEVIKSLLEANSGNKEATIEACLQMTVE